VKTLVLYKNRNASQVMQLKDNSVDGIVKQLKEWLWADAQVRGDGLTLGDPDGYGRTVHIAYDNDLPLGERWSITDSLDVNGFGGITIEHGWYFDILKLFIAHIREHMEMADYNDG
jgi:hypothetical protein